MRVIDREHVAARRPGRAVTGPHHEIVVARPCRQQIIAVAAVQRVVAGIADQRVVAFIATQTVIARAGIYPVIAAAHPGVDGIKMGQVEGDVVGLGRAVKLEQAGQRRGQRDRRRAARGQRHIGLRVVGGVTRYEGKAAKLRRRHGGRAIDEQALDPGQDGPRDVIGAIKTQRVIAEATVKDRRDIARYRDEVVTVAAIGLIIGAGVQDVIAGAAVQRVDAADAPVQRVIAAEGIEDIIPDPAGQWFRIVATSEHSHGVFPP